MKHPIIILQAGANTLPFNLIIIIILTVFGIWMYKKLNDKSNRIANTKTKFTTDDDQNWEPGRYSALKTVVGLVRILGSLLIVVGILGSLFFFQDNSYMMGGMCILGGIILALPLLAFSNLIYVFVDIEYNTRKTREGVDNLNKQMKNTN